MQYSEHEDYSIMQSSNPEFNKAVVRVDVFHDHRQTVQYIHPTDAAKLGQAELLIIDEAAAIPLPLVKSLLGPYLVFMASTINGSVTLLFSKQFESKRLSFSFLYKKKSTIFHFAVTKELVDLCR